LDFSEEAAMNSGKTAKLALMAALMAMAAAGSARAHHSLAMYDTDKTYVFTGVVTGINPSAAHLVIHFVPLDEARTKVIRDSNGQPDEWSVEMNPAAASAREGVTVNSFAPGTIISVGLHPLRNGGHAGARGNSGLYKCPADTPPQAGKFCDSVPGATAHGAGPLPVATGPAPLD
jgi:hypothetical protein